MNDFLQQIFLDNTIEQYLIVGAVILLVFLFKKYMAHYLAGLVFNLFQNRWKNINKLSFKNLVAKPLGLFLAVLVTVVALDQLKLPAVFDFNLYHLSIRELLRMIGTGLLIITFFLFVIKCFDFIMMAIQDQYVQDKDLANHQLFFFFKDFIKVLIGILGLLLILKYTFNYDVKGLVTGLSIVGAAVALALKESLENLIASVIIFFDKPFATGDVVKVNNVTGTVEKIGLRSTRIRSDAKTYITVPNKQMVDSIVDNQSNRTQRKAELRLEIRPATPPQKVQQLLSGLKEILTNQEIENFNLFLNDISAAALIINAEYFTAPDDATTFQNIKQKVNLQVLTLLDSLGIEVAGMVTDVKIMPAT